MITGSAKRLGREIALTLAKEGYSVIIHYNTSQKEAEETAAECRRYSAAESLQGDLSSKEGVIDFGQRYLEKFPKTQALINNVGNFFMKSLTSTSMEEWTELFMTNLHAPFYLSKLLLPSIKLVKGSIINIGTSGLHSIKAFKETPAYSLTKLSLYGLTTSLAKEVAKDQVCVNMVSPGVLDIAVDLEEHPHLPMGRAGSPTEVAAMISFLLKKENRYITGQNIEVAGGFAL